MNTKYILVINPGSTSTKIAIYNNYDEVFTENISHDVDIIDSFENIASQYEYRMKCILDVLESKKFNVNDLECVIGRGGVGLKPVQSGAYLVNDLMVHRLGKEPMIEHASNLGAIISKSIADQIECNAYIYDSVATDEMLNIARVSGLPEITRSSAFHALNSRATAMKVAQEKESTYKDLNFIVAHLGGGISVSAHQKGRAIDIVADDEGPFSPERAGTLPTSKLMALYNEGKYTYKEFRKRLRGKGGVRAYLGTTDMREVMELTKTKKEAALIVDAMVYQIAKSIGSLATTFGEAVDYIIVTGGIAYDEYIVKEIEKRVGIIAPVCVVPGENEMAALASGACRVLDGEERAKEYNE